MHRNTVPARFAKLGITVAAIALTFMQLCPGAAFAAAEGCTAIYYRAKSPACIDDALAQFRQMGENNYEAPNGLIGFLAELFRAYPRERERLLNAERSDYEKSVNVVSLYRADLPDEAQKFAAANGLSSLSDQLRAAQISPLGAVKPFIIPGDNDLLIGAYMASGDTSYIERILDNYASADDTMVKDGLRVGFMTGKFGLNLAPRGRGAMMIRAACAKYDFEGDPTKFMRVMTLGRAIWSLQSMAAQDDGIKKAFSDFFSRDARLKILLAAERAAFENYLKAITFVSTFEDRTEPDQDQQRAYSMMNKAASSYENLGSSKDAFEPFNNLKK